MLLNLQKAASPDRIAATTEQSRSKGLRRSERDRGLVWRSVSSTAASSGLESVAEESPTEHTALNVFPMKDIVDIRVSEADNV